MDISEQVVHDLLAHLADTAYLQGHALAGALQGEGGQRGEGLRRLLLEHIEQLRPPAGTPAADPAWRPYLALRLRYVEMRGAARVQELLSLSDRQVRREQSRAISALTAILRHSLAADTDGGARDALTQATESLTVAPATLDLLAELQAIARTLAARLDECGAHLRMPAAGAVTAYADRVTLRQILLHLLSALAPIAGPGAITVEVAREGQEAIVRLAPGAGVAGEVPLSPEVLAACSHLAELNLGRVWSEGEGAGWAVCCALPAERPLQLLVIDDEATAGRLLRRYVQGLGIRVVATEGSEQAFAAASSLRPDVVVLDVLMPGRDGWEVMQQLKALPETRGIPVIVCSVWNEPELALSLGAAAFLRKPVTRAQFLRALQAALPSEIAARVPPGHSSPAPPPGSDRGRPGN